MTLTRRTFLGSAAALPFVTAAGTAIAQEAGSPSSVKLGDTREAFDAAFGSPVEQDGWVAYLTDQTDIAHYYVGFDQNQNSEQILGDFEPLEARVLNVDESDLGTSQFVRDDAVADEFFKLGYLKEGYGTFAVQAWHSESLAKDTGRSGWVIVMDELGLAGDQWTDGYGIRGTRISMEAYEANEIVPTGEDLGPHSGREEWVAYNDGNDSMGEAGLYLTVEPIPGRWICNSGSVSATFENPLTPEEAAAEIARRLPPGELTWTAWLPQMREDRFFAQRFHRFQAEDTVYIAQQVMTGTDEASARVQRITLAKPHDEVSFFSS